ncbi:PaaI family thioesterase [Blastococcus brunescens]|uniref:PaaI family thioesterase n=1 Tax=Blastococcus brunescens TaxID=1564165 RepID=A0ABZ1AUI8_9ACTN|nr:PaaI family thioesterase [Blastococcus sp. BMG 8361]WRL62114.1 PaaI family thioesterase [Blastococcus sp. BMG 8361]
MSDDGAGQGGFAEQLGARAEVADDGSARMSFTVLEEHLNQAGALHGGVLATLVDTAMGAAVRSAVDAGDVPATSQLTVTYLRPGSPAT